MANQTITVAYGDGIGPEIMEATLKILDAAKVPLNYERIKIGKEVFEQGFTSGIPSDAWDILRKNDAFLKAPITTPQGSGYKSLNVTLRKTMSLFANVRPVKTYTPFVESNFPGMDVVVIRENEEDLYAGIEHQQTPEVVQCLKLVSVPGSERIIRYAFEYARANGRKKVTCMSKDNIMKLTDGMFHKVFDRIASEYPDIENEHWIIDIGSALLADQPQRFDVVVTLNLYGDIISDITAQIAGSVGLGGSANVGESLAMFEAIHGSAPDIAGKGIANPSGLLNGACMMLTHLGFPSQAELISNAWLKTLEDGLHTGDFKNDRSTKKLVNTEEFSQAIIDRLGEIPEKLPAVHLNKDSKPIHIETPKQVVKTKKLVGVDVFIDWTSIDRNPDDLGKKLETLAGDDLKLKMITNRGVKVYPGGQPETFKTDHWRCRFVQTGVALSYHAITGLLDRLSKAELFHIKTENLYEIEGQRAYSLGQGE